MAYMRFYAKLHGFEGRKKYFWHTVGILKLLILIGRTIYAIQSRHDKRKLPEMTATYPIRFTVGSLLHTRLHFGMLGLQTFLCEPVSQKNKNIFTLLDLIAYTTDIFIQIVGQLVKKIQAALLVKQQYMCLIVLLEIQFNSNTHAPDPFSLWQPSFFSLNAREESLLSQLLLLLNIMIKVYLLTVSPLRSCRYGIAWSELTSLFAFAFCQCQFLSS